MCRKFCFSHPLSNCHQYWPSRFAVHGSLLTPSILHQSDFREITHYPQKKILNIKEIVKKVYSDKTLNENADVNEYPKDEGGKPAAEAADQRHLNAMASVAGIAAEVENDTGQDVSTKTLHATLHTNLQLSKKLL